MNMAFVLPLLLAGTLMNPCVCTKANMQTKEQCTKKQVTGCPKAEVSDITIQYNQVDQVIKNKEGVVMLSIQGNTPTINITAFPKATKKINAFYQKQQKSSEEKAKEYTKMAEEDYNMRTPEQKEYWTGYGMGDTYTNSRVDEVVLSMTQTSYEYTGGAHPNSFRYAQNFDAQTGKQLTLKDIAIDVNKLTEAVNTFIFETVQKQEYKDYLFPDYKDSIKDILSNQTWYFSDEGLVIISNEYIITPHAVGILEFTMPYKDLTGLVKPEYLPSK